MIRGKQIEKWQKFKKLKNKVKKFDIAFRTGKRTLCYRWQELYVATK